MTFLLLHGARHGAWCWDLLVRELEARGEHAIAVDLPVEDESAGAERYAEVAAEAVRDAGGPPVVVVGHSLGGLVIPLLPALIDVHELVFLCSPLPVPGRTLWEQLEQDPDIFVADSVQPTARQGGQVIEATEEYAIKTYFHDCGDELARWAAGRLRRQSTRATTEPSPVSVWPPSVPCRYVLGSNDRIVNPEWSRREVPRRLGIEPVELDTGHSPFLARPAELADVLVGG
jgi:pimeloyl-ACP methyl ester carboxylesterase